MFIKYQHVRNAVVGATALVLGGLGYAFTREPSHPRPEIQPKTFPVADRASDIALPRRDNTPLGTLHERNASSDELPDTLHSGSLPVQAETDSAEMPSAAALLTSQPAAQKNMAVSNPNTRAAHREDATLARYTSAMRIAEGRARANGKDVLGPSNTWKLNLYDDNNDGQWDRGKLDYNRDEIDDEKWTFKKGRWEKDGGKKIWEGDNWVSK